MNSILSIWIKPRKTFEFLAGRDEEVNDNTTKILFFLTPMVGAFSAADDLLKLFVGNYYVLLIIAFIFSGLFGFFFINYILSYIILIVSKLFQGKGTIDEIRLVIAYSLIPNFILIIFGLIMIVPAIIYDSVEVISYKHPITIYVLWIFAIRTIIYGLAYFNKYSYGYALLTFFIPATIIQGLTYGIIYLLG